MNAGLWCGREGSTESFEKRGKKEKERNICLLVFCFVVNSKTDECFLPARGIFDFSACISCIHIYIGTRARI